MLLATYSTSIVVLGKSRLFLALGTAYPRLIELSLAPSLASFLGYLGPREM